MAEMLTGLLSEGDVQQVASAQRDAAEALSADPTQLLVRRQSTVSLTDLAPLIEHTILSQTATGDQVLRKCREVEEFGFHGICVNPKWVALSAKELAGSSRAVISVVGFPLGATVTSIKVHEATLAVNDGATELDMVADLGALRERDLSGFAEDIRAVVDQVGKVPVKVILECGLLTDAYELALAASLAALAGARFVKTSTGFAYNKSGGESQPLGATLKDVSILAHSVGGTVGIKASGGINDYPQATALVRAGATRIGTSSGPAIMRGSLR